VLTIVIDRSETHSLVFSCRNGAAAPGATAAYCKPWRVRKDYKSLTAAERALYHSALSALYGKENRPASATVGAEANYHYFVNLHQLQSNTDYAHGPAGFLPWHRKYLLEFENALRASGPEYANVMLPYWDWGQWAKECMIDLSACSSFVSGSNGVHIFNSANFGGSGGTDGQGWTTGTTYASASTPAASTGGIPAVGWKFPRTGGGWAGTPKYAAGYGWVVRDTNMHTDWSTSGPITGQVQSQLIIEEDNHYTFSPVQTLPGGRISGGFQQTYEDSPHNWIHTRMRGTMGSMDSPGDPIFWSHHAYIDKMWAMWQDCHGKHREATLPSNPRCTMRLETELLAAYLHRPLHRAASLH
jgi:tyrosinase